jgi:hypothetical protein
MSVRFEGRSPPINPRLELQEMPAKWAVAGGGSRPARQTNAAQLFSGLLEGGGRGSALAPDGRGLLAPKDTISFGGEKK